MSTRDGKELLAQNQQNGIYIIKALATKEDPRNMSFTELHQLFGHLNYGKLKSMLKNCEDFKINEKEDVLFNLYEGETDKN